MWIGRGSGIVGLLATSCLRHWGNSGTCLQYSYHSSVVQRIQLRQADVHTIVTLTDNAPQGLNQALSSSFAHATQVGTRLQFNFTN